MNETAPSIFTDVNRHIQIVQTVIAMLTGTGTVRAQSHADDGDRHYVTKENGGPPATKIALSGNARRCRIATKDHANNFAPVYALITTSCGAFGHGAQVEGGLSLVPPLGDGRLPRTRSKA